ncbi:MAG TPA: hypothetical protein VI669_07870 [Vicinamibacteria bacterium]
MRRSTGWALVLMLAMPALVAADKPNKNKAKHKDKGKAHGESHQEGRVTLVFSTHEREKVQGYFVEKHGRGKCPPGLAKKRNGCLPPGQEKKRYVVGRPLPPTVVVAEPPADLVVRIGVAPRGYRYVIVDGDLVKLAVGTALVVDAIEGLLN